MIRRVHFNGVIIFVETAANDEARKKFAPVLGLTSKFRTAELQICFRGQVKSKISMSWIEIL